MNMYQEAAQRGETLKTLTISSYYNSSFSRLPYTRQTEIVKSLKNATSLIRSGESYDPPEELKFYPLSSDWSGSHITHYVGLIDRELCPAKKASLLKTFEECINALVVKIEFAMTDDLDDSPEYPSWDLFPGGIDHDNCCGPRENVYYQ